MRRAIIGAAMAATVAGCASPTPELRPSAFRVDQAGRIAPADVPRFADCVSDGFAAAHGVLTRIESSRQRRADGEWVESRTGNAVLARAEVDDSGAVRLVVTNNPLLTMGAERDAFAACLARYAAGAT